MFSTEKFVFSAVVSFFSNDFIDGAISFATGGCCEARKVSEVEEGRRAAGCCREVGTVSEVEEGRAEAGRCRGVGVGRCCEAETVSEVEKGRAEAGRCRGVGVGRCCEAETVSEVEKCRGAEAGFGGSHSKELERNPEKTGFFSGVLSVTVFFALLLVSFFSSES
jgi:hypothetical protein